MCVCVCVLKSEINQENIIPWNTPHPIEGPRGRRSEHLLEPDFRSHNGQTTTKNHQRNRKREGGGGRKRQGKKKPLQKQRTTHSIHRTSSGNPSGLKWVM